MAISRYNFHKKASIDLEHIIDWYEQLSPELGLQFLQELELYLVQIIQNPQAYKPVTKGIRRCLMKRFPYIIYFIEKPDFILVIRVRGKRQRTLKRYV